MQSNVIICGDCLEVLPTLPKAKMVFADPPDNTGVRYEGYEDRRGDYLDFLHNIVVAGCEWGEIFWLSLSADYLSPIFPAAARLFIWRYTFGQHNNHDCGRGFRPILRIMHEGAKIYPDAIREQSQRQRNGDKRANPAGRVPDDVWEFPRICGTFKERRKWHPCQHPEGLIERMVKLSTVEGDLVIDMFAGSGIVNRVCKRLNRRYIGIEISPFYCEEIKEELSLS